MLLVLAQQGPLRACFQRKMSKLIPQRSVLEEQREAEATKSRVVPPAASVTGDFKTVEQQDPLLASQIITIKATRIAALAHDPPKRLMEIDKN